MRSKRQRLKNALKQVTKKSKELKDRFSQSMRDSGRANPHARKLQRKQSKLEKARRAIRRKLRQSY